MVNRSLILVLAFCAANLSALSGQGWEATFSHPDLILGAESVIYPGIDNSVQVGVYAGTILGEHRSILSFDETGTLSNQDNTLGADGWRLLSGNKYGETFWLKDGQLKKLTINKQFAWTYPCRGNVSTIQFLPNGNICFLNEENSVFVLDLIDRDGQLVNRFYVSPDEFKAGCDNSLLYTLDPYFLPTRHWVKIDMDGNVIWEQDMNSSFILFSGAFYDGSVYFEDYATNAIIKIDAAGNIAWEHAIVNDAPNHDGYFHTLGIFVRSDESIILSTVHPSYSFMQFISINPDDGTTKWITRTNNTASNALDGPMAEMPDGGILACYGLDSGVDSGSILIIRTDALGHTLTNLISGRVFIDENNNCQPELAENALRSMTIKAVSGNKTYSATSNSEGGFSMRTTGANPVLSVAFPGNYIAPCAFQNTLEMSAFNDSAWVSIGVQAIVDCPQLELSVGGVIFRRCFDNTLTVQYHNYGTAPAVNAYVTITLPAELIYQSATAPLLNQNGQTFTFDVGTIGVGEGGAFSLYFKVDCNADLGEVLCVESQIYPNTLCIPTAKDMTFNRFCLPVASSFDPNDKTALVNGKPEMVKILPDKELEYLIRFQNTGNDTAFNIVVTDTLSEQLDAATVVPGAASHPCSFELRNGNVLRFTFNNILLPDSNTNEAASHGFVKFAIRQRPGNAIGTNILNTAAIYFDHNTQVLTNTSKLLVSNSVSTQEAPVLYARTLPVPAHKQVTILLPYAALSWKLLDVNGRVLRTGASAESTFTLQREGLPGGLYWCQCTLANGQTAVSKIVFD